MQAQILSRASAWSELNTVTTFDAGGATRPVDSMSDKKYTVENIRSFSPSSLLVESLIEHLCRLLEKDPANQKNLYKVICGKLHQMKLIDKTYGLEEFESLRGYYQKALVHLVTVAKSTVEGNEDNSIVKLSNYSANLELSPSVLKEEQILHWSRYSTDYVELKFIAKGGFGQVFQVRNKLDGEEYAVKKIFLRYRNLNSFYRNIQEVKLLAKLNHPNIVAYKAAWLEPLFSFTSNHISPQESELEDVSDVSDVSQGFPKPVLNNVETEESSSIIFKENDSEKKTETSTQGAAAMEKPETLSTRHVHSRTVSEVFLQSSNASTSGASSMFKSEAAITMDNFVSGHKEDCSVEVKALQKEKAVCRFMIQAENTNQDSNIQHEWVVLYIQMQLCSSTLRDWLNERNAISPSVNVKECLRIFHDIVLGVQYIHSQGIVHHDIKPNNIFVNGVSASQIKVGDFGLACFLHHSSDDVTLIASHNHRGEFGTRLYAAPEQLEGKCDIKSDIYSLGIILFELLCPFRTDMERSLVLTNLRNGTFPSEMDEQNPELMQLIRKLLLQDVQLRPSAEDILLSLESLTKNVPRDSVPPEDKEYQKGFIEQLREELMRKNQEIEELRKRVQALESKSNKNEQ
ncbi:Eukaryotic translation initiation factor 2-alpha kinase 1 [Gryllus bimaculatus]|nr:Eukaryotic translation initiation factor 2-alpha kinase 1 [Gryllus bimaculatus]